MSRTLILSAAMAAGAALLSPFNVTPAHAQAPAQPAASASSPSAAKAPLPEVTVIGRRELARRITGYVARITSLENGEGLARWKAPVCPRVQGLPPEEGEAVLARITEIASEARIPLAGETCHPNLFIVMTAGSTQFLKALNDRETSVLFGSSSRVQVQEFVDRPDPVKVWYNTGRQTAWGLQVAETLPSARTHPALDHPTITQADSSHLINNVVWTTTSAFVIVDQTLLNGVTRGQFADYVAMVGLAQIKPISHLGDADTILRLFESGPANSPPGLTAWDSTFLKFLYSTEPRLKAQRKDIVYEMVNEIIPRGR